MIPAHARNAYIRSEAQGKDIAPEQLIHLLYERALKHLQCAAEGIVECNPQKRGENLGKAIAFVSELNASLDLEKGGEVAEFLRGLYEAILLELSKVSLTNDREIIERACRYLTALKDSWERTVMPAASGVTHQAQVSTQAPEAPRRAVVQKFPLPAAREPEGKRLSVSV
jgi:flagellar protein FliS